MNLEAEIRKSVNAELGILTMALTESGASDYSDYRHLTGRIYSLRFVLRELDGIKKAEALEDD